MKYLSFFLAFVFTALPVFVSAQAVNIPTLVDLPIKNQGNFNDYINLLYKLSISAAALLAVVKIIIAGAKYMLTDIVTTKGEAKKDIQGALVGLLIIVGAVVILETINPALINGGLTLSPVERLQGLGSQSPVAVGGQSSKQLSADLAAGLSTCAQRKDGTGSSGKTLTASLNISGCTSEERPDVILATFTTRCREKGGTPKPSSDGKMVACAVPIDVKEEVKVDEFKTTSDDCLVSIPTTVLGPLGPKQSFICKDVELDSKYVTQNGRTVTYDADRACAEMYPDMDQDDCKEEIKDAFSSSDDLDISGFFQDTYCETNGGKIISAYVCELPSQSGN
jgi:hypothetical protein